MLSFVHDMNLPITGHLFAVERACPRAAAQVSSVSHQCWHEADGNSGEETAGQSPWWPRLEDQQE